jgi:acyl carrier protein
LSDRSEEQFIIGDSETATLMTLVTTALPWSERIAEYISSACGIDVGALSPSTSLRDLSLDSMSLTMIIANFEADTDNFISDEDTVQIMKAASIGDLVSVLLQYTT